MEQKLTEEQTRSLVGAPTKEEEQLCACGEQITECNEAYVHMTSGV